MCLFGDKIVITPKYLVIVQWQIFFKKIFFKLVCHVAYQLWHSSWAPVGPHASNRAWVAQRLHGMRRSCPGVMARGTWPGLGRWGSEATGRGWQRPTSGGKQPSARVAWRTAGKAGQRARPDDRAPGHAQAASPLGHVAASGMSAYSQEHLAHSP